MEESALVQRQARQIESKWRAASSCPLLFVNSSNQLVAKALLCRPLDHSEAVTTDDVLVTRIRFDCPSLLPLHERSLNGLSFEEKKTHLVNFFRPGFAVAFKDVFGDSLTFCDRSVVLLLGITE